MCGIVGTVGKADATPILLEGLSRLEYRGYDSAGVAVVQDGKLCVEKAKGRLKNLCDRLEQRPLHGTLGIGHTRWATHGEPSDINSHPHTDVKGEIAVVHNGIIENYAQLKRFLEKEGCTFVSATDTEVVAHLINYYDRGDIRRAIEQALHRLEGSYALGIICQREPDTLYCVRKDSPLVVGLGDGQQYIASDIPAILPYTRDVYFLQDREIAVLQAHSVTVYDAYGRVRTDMQPFHVDWDVAAAEKGGYPHFMLKEIMEEPRALMETLRSHVNLERLEIVQEGMPTAEEARALQRVYIVACGTAYHAGVVGKYAIEQLTGLSVTVDIASEYRYRPQKLRKDDLFLVISQSGETADTLAALREAKRQGAKVAAITNVVGSSVAREADRVLYTWAGPEIAVASTKAYITQLLLLVLLGIDLAVKRGEMDEAQARDLLREMQALPEKAQKTVETHERMQRFAARHFDVRHIFYIGRGMDWALAMEASLKLKEISYIFSEAYAAGELKHGTIALIEPGTLVVALLTQSALLDKTRSNIKEVRARGASVLCVQRESAGKADADIADKTWLIPDAPDLLMPMLAVIPMQLLAYYMAVSKGCDVDKPRNLAKSVTVE